ncbi:MAG TPA: hypothetical protein VGX91_04265 [Candidatus Cybelea sp.]|jgi:hypothetical protein|nr:hypothetical protein [Candidatus Cybelea sp.]
MEQRATLRLLVLGAILLLGVNAAPHSSTYLFTWAMEIRNPGADMPEMATMGKDFLAVFDVAPDATSFGRLVAMLPVGVGAKMAHHTSYALPPNDVLFANDWLADRTYAIDVRDPLHPRLVFGFANVGRYMYPHSFVYLSNGNTLATFQYSGGYNRAPGGLVELDARGKAVKTSSAAAPAVDRNVRPYSLAVVESLDRIVTSSADMMGAQKSHVVQVWRLSDLKLLKTLSLPESPHWYADDAADSSEPRVLGDGHTVVVPTFHCGLFIVEKLATNPTLKHVYDAGYRTCEVPVVVGNYLVLAMQSGHAVASLDIRDPQHPREASRLLLAPDQYPHWLAIEPGGDRIVITGVGSLQTHALFARIDRDTGELTLDPQSIDFTRMWPDGWNGPAMPHGAVFSNQ